VLETEQMIQYRERNAKATISWLSSGKGYRIQSLSQHQEATLTLKNYSIQYFNSLLFPFSWFLQSGLPSSSSFTAPSYLMDKMKQQTDKSDKVMTTIDTVPPEIALLVAQVLRKSHQRINSTSRSR